MVNQPRVQKGDPLGRGGQWKAKQVPESELPDLLWSREAVREVDRVLCGEIDRDEAVRIASSKEGCHLRIALALQSIAHIDVVRDMLENEDHPLVLLALRENPALSDEERAKADLKLHAVLPPGVDPDLF